MRNEGRMPEAGRRPAREPGEHGGARRGRRRDRAPHGRGGRLPPLGGGAPHPRLHLGRPVSGRAHLRRGRLPVRGGVRPPRADGGPPRARPRGRGDDGPPARAAELRHRAAFARHGPLPLGGVAGHDGEGPGAGVAAADRSPGALPLGRRPRDGRLLDRLGRRDGVGPPRVHARRGPREGAGGRHRPHDVRHGARGPRPDGGAAEGGGARPGLARRLGREGDAGNQDPQGRGGAPRALEAAGAGAGARRAALRGSHDGRGPRRRRRSDPPRGMALADGPALPGA